MSSGQQSRARWNAHLQVWMETVCHIPTPCPGKAIRWHYCHWTPNFDTISHQVNFYEFMGLGRHLSSSSQPCISPVIPYMPILYSGKGKREEATHSLVAPNPVLSAPLSSSLIHLWTTKLFSLFESKTGIINWPTSLTWWAKMQPQNL